MFIAFSGMDERMDGEMGDPISPSFCNASSMAM